MDGTGKAVTVKVEFSGGLETLFNNEKKTTVPLPLPSPTIADLLRFIDTNILPPTANRALFFSGDAAAPAEIDVRPGILVLINDFDWELEGGLETPLKDGDEVLFVSTLHGG